VISVFFVIYGTHANHQPRRHRHLTEKEKQLFGGGLDEIVRHSVSYFLVSTNCFNWQRPVDFSSFAITGC